MEITVKNKKGTIITIVVLVLIAAIFYTASLAKYG